MKVPAVSTQASASTHDPQHLKRRTEYYVGVSAVLFVIGALGVLVRRNPLVIFMSIEIMLNAANLAFVAFGERHGSINGQALVIGEAPRSPLQSMFPDI